jgi:hypothetical protein
VGHACYDKRLPTFDQWHRLRPQYADLFKPSISPMILPAAI